MSLVQTRILMVEDNPGDAFLLQKALREKKEPPYLLEKVESLHDCLENLSPGKWDVVLLDLFLPDSSGLDTLKSILKKTAHVPIVVLTGLKDKETAEKALQEGAQDFLTKDDLDGSLLQRSISYSIERYHLLEKIRESEERYSLAAMGSHDGLWDWDLKLGRIYFSPRWKLMLGYSETEISNHPSEWFKRIHPKDLAKVKHDLSSHLSGKTSHFSNEHRLRNKDDLYQWVLSRGLAIMDFQGQATRVSGSFTDITHHKNMEQQLALRAYYDPLTGLPNRLHFMDNLNRAFTRLKRHPDSLFALFFLDLDRLKTINDNMGHQAGDFLLMEFARRLRFCVRPNDLVARIGGDEFTVLLEDLQTRVEATQVAKRILKSLQEPFIIKEKDVMATASIGIAYSDCGKNGPDDIIHAADAAMYHAKICGKARYEIF